MGLAKNTSIIAAIGLIASGIAFLSDATILLNLIAVESALASEDVTELLVQHVGLLTVFLGLFLSINAFRKNCDKATLSIVSYLCRFLVGYACYGINNKERFPAATDGFGQLEVLFIASVLLSLVTYLVGAIDDSLADPDTVAVSGTNAIYRGAFIFAALITGVAFGIQLGFSGRVLDAVFPSARELSDEIRGQLVPVVWLDALVAVCLAGAWGTSSRQPNGPLLVLLLVAAAMHSAWFGWAVELYDDGIVALDVMVPALVLGASIAVWAAVASFLFYIGDCSSIPRPAAKIIRHVRLQEEGSSATVAAASEGVELTDTPPKTITNSEILFRNTFKSRPETWGEVFFTKLRMVYYIIPTWVWFLMFWIAVIVAAAMYTRLKENSDIWKAVGYSSILIVGSFYKYYKVYNEDFDDTICFSINTIKKRGPNDKYKEDYKLEFRTLVEKPLNQVFASTKLQHAIHRAALKVSVNGDPILRFNSQDQKIINIFITNEISALCGPGYFCDNIWTNFINQNEANRSMTVLSGTYKFVFTLEKYLNQEKNEKLHIRKYRIMLLLEEDLKRLKTIKDLDWHLERVGHVGRQQTLRHMYNMYKREDDSKDDPKVEKVLGQSTVSCHVPVLIRNADNQNLTTPFD